MSKLISDLANQSIAIKIGDEWVKLNVLSTADNAKFNKLYTHVHQLYHASDLTRVLSYLAKIKCIDYKVTLNGVEYDIRDNLNEDDSELPDLNEVLDYYGVNDLISRVGALEEGGGSGLSLFDVVAKDHILEYGKDLEGFAPLGTWVYKDAIPGSRYGYPDFYQKCLDEYNEAIDDVIPYRKWEQPILSANGTLGGDEFAVASNIPQHTSGQVWRGFDRNNSTLFHSDINSTTGYIDIYNPVPICVREFKFRIQAEGSSIFYSRTTAAGNIYGSDDGTNWTLIKAYTNPIPTTLEFSINVSENVDFYKYYRFESTACSDVYWTFAELSLTAYDQYLDIKRHVNGHIYFDVADIETVDTYFNTYDHAWFYGIDETNERVFLPRQAHGKLIESYKNGADWYRIYEDGWCEQGGYVSSSKTLIFRKPYIDSNYTLTYGLGSPSSYADSCMVKSASAYNGVKTNTSFYTHADVNVSKEWQALGYIDLEDTEVTPSYDYMVVGNARVEAAATVVDLSAAENDTTPLFTAHYFDFKPNNLSWLKAGEQINSGSLYASCYSELVNALSDSIKYGSLKVIDESDMVEGEDYSLYWKVDQVNQTFRTPTATQQRFVVKTWQNGTDWYRIYNDGWCEQGTIIGGSSTYNATLIHQFKDLNYQVYVCYNTDSTGTSGGVAVAVNKKTISSFEIKNAGGTYSWFACGYINLTNELIDTALYFKVANAVENIELLDVGEVTEALTSKADTTLVNTSNVAQAFKDMSMGWALPDYTAGIAISSGFTAPSIGFIAAKPWDNSGNIYINGRGVMYFNDDGAGGNSQTGYLLIDKNDVFTADGSWSSFSFFPCKGAN